MEGSMPCPTQWAPVPGATTSAEELPPSSAILTSCGAMGMPVWQHDGMQSEVVKGVSGAVRTLTIRLPASEARRAVLVARAESISVNELTRRALTAYSDNRCANEEFLAHARALVEQDAALIDGSR